ncbi:MAG: hypothetical protein B7X35_03205 [Halothiobacillus sp. 14-56-357]|nr:MAG: hypothetical protein B7X44_04325 [Halothiobacillus sp. 15-55-196]OZB57007.1 MAG: hypothetical protein B7X35_03205 [Halothiobacillus sp. 14-56-357]OZB78592.1 MAG: hypothetical protein B7X29_04210 [Halothiobacillus sp. 13-55-115]
MQSFPCRAVTPCRTMTQVIECGAQDGRVPACACLHEAMDGFVQGFPKEPLIESFVAETGF